MLFGGGSTRMSEMQTERAKPEQPPRSVPWFERVGAVSFAASGAALGFTFSLVVLSTAAPLAPTGPPAASLAQGRSGDAVNPRVGEPRFLAHVAAGPAAPERQPLAQSSGPPVGTDRNEKHAAIDPKLSPDVLAVIPTSREEDAKGESDSGGVARTDRPSSEAPKSADEPGLPRGIEAAPVAGTDSRSQDNESRARDVSAGASDPGVEPAGAESARSQNGSISAPKTGYRGAARTGSRTSARRRYRTGLPESSESEAAFMSSESSVGSTATGIPTYVGPRGGVYHYSASGKKVYQWRR